MVWEMVELAWLEAETRRMTIGPYVEPDKVREEYDRVEDIETGVAEQMLDVEEETLTNITEMIGYWEAEEEMEMIAAKKRTSVRIQELAKIFNPNPKDNCHNAHQEVTTLENNTISENIPIFSKTCTKKPNQMWKIFKTK